jgi:DNA-binding CsgD family transcriptional regulator
LERAYLHSLLDDLLESCDMRQVWGMSCLFAFILLFCLSSTFIPVHYVMSPVHHIALLALLVVLLLVVNLLSRRARKVPVRLPPFEASGEDSETAIPMLMPTAAIMSGLLLSVGVVCLRLPESVVAIAVAASLIAIGATPQLLCWAHAVASVRLRRRVVSTGFAGIASPMVYLLLIALPDGFTVVLASLLPLASGVLGFLYWRRQRPPKLTGHAIDSSVTKRLFAFPLDTRLGRMVFCYGCLFTLVGYALLQAEPQQVPIKLPGLICVVLFLVSQVLMAFYMVRIIHVESPRVAYRPVPILIAIGFMILPFASQTIIMVSMAVAFTGFGCFIVYYWIILGNAVNRYRCNVVAVYAFGLALMAGGALIGELIVLVLDSLGIGSPLFSQVVALIGLFILVLALWQAADGSIFANETREMGGSFSTEPEAVLTDARERAQVLAVIFSLSPREQDVTRLIISGRNVPAICDELFISKHTVQTHVKHIYTKTGVSKRQQLLDLADELQQG